jgi:hypothetical protein
VNTHWLRCAITGVLSGEKDVDADVVLGVAHSLGPRETFDPPATEPPRLERREAFTGEQKIDVGGSRTR